MLPVILDGAKLVVLLVGRGPEVAKRLAWLRAGGAERLQVFCDEPTWIAETGIQARLPTDAEIAAAHLVWVTGIEPTAARSIAAVARATGTLVNIEDDLFGCDFHTPAVVRRGDLLLTVSTGGRSPGLAQRIKAWLEHQFGPEWSERLELIASKRQAWRRRPRSLNELATLTGAVLDRRGWLDGSARSKGDEA